MLNVCEFMCISIHVWSAWAFCVYICICAVCLRISICACVVVLNVFLTVSPRLKSFKFIVEFKMSYFMDKEMEALTGRVTFPRQVTGLQFLLLCPDLQVPSLFHNIL